MQQSGSDGGVGERRRLHRISSDNLYQIRKRVKAVFADLLKAALADHLPPGQ